VVAQLQAALANDAPTAALVTALRPEHLAFAAEFARGQAPAGR
jgi:hypothetical protein